MFEADYDYWTQLKKCDVSRYNEEKDRIAKEIINELEEYFGDINTNVEVYDVATPYTFVRYTNNWKGSFEGFVGFSLGAGLPTSAMMHDI